MSRRDLLKATGTVAAASALAGVVLPRHVYAGETNTIQIALVGAGGRGSGAAAECSFDETRTGQTVGNGRRLSGEAERQPSIR